MNSSTTQPHFMEMFASKLPAVGTTIFTVMSQLAQEHNAINLAQGFPNFPCAPELVNFAEQAMRSGLNQYAPMAGYMPLRERIAEKTKHLYGRNVNPETELTITPGGTVALYCAMTAVLRPADEVIVFEPCYDSYLPTIELCGAKAVCYALQFPDYSIDWEALQSLISPKTRMIILNTPHNPTGVIWSREDMLRLAALVRNTNIVIVSDEVYEHIVFDSNEHQSISRFPELAERSFIVSSFGKTFHVTGWKTGYCLAPKEFTREFRKVYQFVNFAAHTPSQVAFAEMLREERHYVELSAFYQRKRDMFRALLTDSQFELLPSRGSYFQLARYRNVLNAHPDAPHKDADFAVWMTTTHGVATIPVSAFYADAADNTVIRFCFAKTDETLERAAEMLCRL